MGTARQTVGSLLVLVFVVVVTNPSHAQSDDLFDGLLSNDEPRTGLTDWKGFIEFMPRQYVHGAVGRANDQVIVWSEFEADFRLNDRVSAHLRPRLYADVGSEPFDRWQVPDAHLTYATDTWDLRAGLMVENWGVADTFSPLDILNPRDFATEVLDPLKIGQAGLRLRRWFAGGVRLGEPTLSLYWMPDFQSARYAPLGQRLHPGSATRVFDRGNETEPDGADATMWGLRFQSTLQTDFINTDLQVIATVGPDRSPPVRELNSGRVSPVHQRVKTVGFGFRAVPNARVFGHFLSTLTVKGEAVRRSFERFSDSPFNPSDAYWTYVFGVNKEWPNLFRDQDELAVTLEYIWDTDSVAASNQRLIQHDVILRLLWNANNFNKTSVQLRGVLDGDDHETVLEASFSTLLRAISEDLTLVFRYQYFHGHGESTFLSRLPDPSSVALSLRWVFAE